MLKATRKTGRYKWEMSEKEKATLTAADLVGFIGEFDLLDCRVVPIDFDKANHAIIFYDGDNKELARISYDNVHPIEFDVEQTHWREEYTYRKGGMNDK